MRSSRHLFVIVVGLALGLALGACSRPGEKRCTEVCEHYLTLYLADKYDERLAAARDDDARAKLQAERDAEAKDRRENPEKGFEQCVNRCNRRSRGTVADCVKGAETLAAAKECDAEEEACSVSLRPGRTPVGVVLLLGLVFVCTRRRRSGRHRR